MIESDFQDLVDGIYLQIEDQIEDSGADLDFEVGGGVMTITCENDGSKIILSRQPATSEIWVAARSGGYHFKSSGDDWVCATGENLAGLLQRVLLEQSQEEIPVDLEY